MNLHDILRQRWRAYCKEWEEYNQRDAQYEQQRAQRMEAHIYAYARGLRSPPPPRRYKKLHGTAIGVT